MRAGEIHAIWLVWYMYSHHHEAWHIAPWASVAMRRSTSSRPRGVNHSPHRSSASAQSHVPIACTNPRWSHALPRMWAKKMSSQWSQCTRQSA